MLESLSHTPHLFQHLEAKVDCHREKCFLVPDFAAQLSVDGRRCGAVPLVSDAEATTSDIGQDLGVARLQGWRCDTWMKLFIERKDMVKVCRSRSVAATAPRLSAQSSHCRRANLFARTAVKNALSRRVTRQLLRKRYVEGLLLDG